MSGVTVTVEGVDRLRDQLADLTEDRRARLKAAIANGAAAVQQTAVRSIQEGPKSGTFYGRTKDVLKVILGSASKSAQKRVHQASAPGEAPAADTGELASKIHVRPSADGLSAEVVSGADYSADLEFGTDKIEPRPFMRPALAEHAEEINGNIIAAMRGES